MSKSKEFLTKALGEDFLESLAKSDLWKPGTKTVTELEDIQIGLQVVPRTVMSFLISHLTPMQVGEHKEIQFPMAHSAVIHVDKHEKDTYSGEIFQENKKITEFKFRSIPGVGLVVMSAFELYELQDIKPEKSCDSDLGAKVQALIDERLAFRDMVNKVIDQKISEREAITALFMKKLNNSIEQPQLDKKEESVTNIQLPKTGVQLKEKGSPLRGFLNRKKNKKEFSVQILKGETASCPDCRTDIFDGKSINTCICFGDPGKVYLKKTEDGIKVRFGSGWDVDNINLLLEVLRSKRG